MVHHTREDALTDREYERLIAATHRLEDEHYRLQTRFVVLIAGRLGLRGGEIAHMESSWVDRRNKMIEIPEHTACSKGRNGGVCGYCRQNAAQKVDVSRENYLEAYHRLRSLYGEHDRADIDQMAREQEGEPLSMTDALDSMWSPKTDAGARDVPYDSDSRAALAVEDFFDEFGKVPFSRQGVNRRVNRAAEAADGLSADGIYPHALRATAAEHYAARGLDVIGMKQMFGWAQFSTAQVYVSGSGQATARKLRQLPG